MELSRRDVLAALTASGMAIGAASAIVMPFDETRDAPADVPVGTTQLETAVAAAEVLYPSQVENVEAFVTAYLRGRADGEPAHVEGIAAAADYLEAYAQSWYDDGFASLEETDRTEALHRMGADTADADPDGSDVERVRYYVINEFLFALYTSPTGTELVGLENPQGYPGGLDSYQRGPPS